MYGSLRHVTKHPTISLIHSCTALKELKQIHNQLLIKGLLSDPHLHGQFVATIALENPNNIDYSIEVLDQCDHPNLHTLNSLIRAYSKSSTPWRSFHFYNRILHSNVKLSPDNYTFNFLVRTCAQLLAPEMGLSVHGALVKYGFDIDPHVQSGLIFMYSELGCVSYCHRVFKAIRKPDLVCQTAMVSAFAKCGELSSARELFDKMPDRDPVAWTAMVAGYTQCGQCREALKLFHLMQMEGVRVNEVSMVSVLSACTHLGALDQGRWAHAYIERHKLRMTVTLGTALVDMYAKCGNLKKAMEVFWGMKDKNVYTWTALIDGLATNGFGSESVECFLQMKEVGVVPNEITFISVLKGCSVAGMVKEGREHFDSMTESFRISPRLEHYGLMVDLYGRAGQLQEALNFINNMPVKPHAGAWGALLNACTMYNNRELGELASRKIVELEAKTDGAYVLLSNIYADSKCWDRVVNVRQTMKNRGVTKVPGCSVIEIDGEVHEFIVGDMSHPRYLDIEAMLAEISKGMTSAGSVPNHILVSFDTEEAKKVYNSVNTVRR